MRYRQLVAQKNAEKALASNAAARKQPFYANDENNENDDTTSASPPITATRYSTKTPALLSHQYTPAVSDGSSSGSNSSSMSSQLSSQAGEEEDSTTYGRGGHGINGDGRHNLLSELDAENESSLLPSAGRSNKENVTPSPSTLTAGSLDTVDKILGGMSTATAAAMSVGSSSHKKKVQTVNRHPYDGVGGGKKYMVSKKALRLEGQWAMVGEAQSDGDDTSSSSSSSESDSSASLSISPTSNQGEDGVVNASTNVVQGTPASRVNQDPGELLSTTLFHPLR